ncbi:Maf family protein [Hutsoniella sourekii]|uniref:Maf family protein n=1 Tax=Hutsoniella sourekii TaxID=87650 RepID=UPI000481CCAB|nr:Maf family protein [Hutsoniella sourekii]
MKTSIDYQQEGFLTKFNQVKLVSGSPRRLELLSYLDPEISLNEIDERSIEDHYMDLYEDDPFVERAAKTCCEISKAKLDLAIEPSTLYIAADTIVICQEKIYNKPEDAAEAYAMLRSYFGRSHQVVTSVCLKAEDFLDVFYTLTEVTFVSYYEQLEAAIQAYVDSGLPLDKSGAYGIQELDPRFVASICGDIHTVIGLPVAEVNQRIFNRH